MLAHERVHIQKGRDELEAYLTQLTVMAGLGANSATLNGVRRALKEAERRQSRQ